MEPAGKGGSGAYALPPPSPGMMGAPAKLPDMEVLQHVRKLLTTPAQTSAGTPQYAGASQVGTVPSTPIRAGDPDG